MPPEQLLLASLLQAFYGIRSERLLLEQRNELIMERFPEKLMTAPEVKPLLSDEHFSMDGTLLQAWASHAFLERIDGQVDPPPPPSGPGEDFGAPKLGKKRAEGDFEASSSATRRTAPRSIQTRSCAGHPKHTRHCPATGAMG